MNKKGFVLVETLVVVIFVLLIFAILYESAVPLLGRYKELSYYDDLDTTYDLYYLKKLVTTDTNYSTLLSLDSNYSVLSCTNGTIYNYVDCNNLFNALNLSSNDRFVYINMKELNKNINTFNTDSQITDAIKDYINYIQTDSKILLLEHNGYLSYIELGENISIDNYTKVNVTFNANGGSVDIENKDVAGIYGTLPTPTRSGYKFAGWSVVNSEYTELEYIESTGPQYVNTNYVVKSTTNIEMVFEYLGTDSSATWVVLSGVRGTGGATSSAAFGFWIHRTSLKLGLEYAGYDPGTSSNLPTIGTEEKHAFKNNVGNFYIDNDSTHNAYTSNVFNNSNGTKPIYIFALNNNGSLDSRECHMRLYSYKIYNNNQLVRDYVPVQKVSNNEVGLLDIKNNVFYGNSGTDVFLPGPAKDKITSTSKVLKNTNHELKANWS